MCLSPGEFAQQLEAGGGRPRRGAWAEPQLLGHATNEQGEDPVHACTWLYEDTTDDEWCTLFNLPRHPGMSFGDGRSLAILIRLEDLAAGRYDRLATDQSMGW